MARMNFLKPRIRQDPDGLAKFVHLTLRTTTYALVLNPPNIAKSPK